MSAEKQKNIEAIYPLSPMQQGMLFHYIYNPESAVYFEQFSCRLHGNLDPQAFRRALTEIMRRHSTLRTSFVWKKLDRMMQVVHKELALPIEILDWRNLAASDLPGKITLFFEEDRRKGFNLSKAPLLRFYLIRHSEDSWQFLWSFHHLLTDGWSIPIILKELFTLYEAYQRGLAITLPPARPYQEYIHWLQSQDMNKAKAFWQKQLGGFSSPTPLPADRFRPGDPDIADDYPKLKIDLPKDISATLDRLARQNQLTVNTLVQGAWALLLSRYSGEDDVVFGATVSGRPPQLAGVENMVGLFINTLPVRVKTDDDLTILQWLKQIQSQALDLRDFEFTPLVELQGWTAVPRSMSLFNTIVVFENYPVDASLKERPLSFKVSDVRSYERTNYPLTLVAAFSGILTIEIAYEARRYEAATIQRLLEQMRVILLAIAARPEQKLGNLALIPAQEQRRLLENWNDTATAFEDQLCIHEKFEQYAVSQPQAAALYYNGVTLTYRELNSRVNQLAHFLIKKGVVAETLVGVCLDRSHEMIIAVLATLKAGGAYLPMDPDYPPDRLAYMIEDSRISFLISKASLAGRLPAHNTPMILVDSDAAAIAAESDINPARPIDVHNLAYIIYTSGSTGRPKGVMLRHQGLLNLAAAMRRDQWTEESTRVLQFASFSFDASIAEIFLALLNGGCLYLADRDILLSTELLKQFVNENQIGTITFPPSMLALMNETDYPTLKCIVSAGEACSWEIAERWSKGRLFFNGYGPTESTVGACWRRVTGDAPMALLTPPIGTPIQNTKIYLLDSNLNLVPTGMPGELYISSVQLARGYLNRPDLTAEKFIPDPFCEQPGSRMYRTGDLAHMLPDGDLEFLGRIDHQVKLRGFRIELGEIEALLTRHPVVKDAAVILREDTPGNKYLAAYFIAGNSAAVDKSALQAYLNEHLPEYMVPGVYVALDHFPMTANGKVDRKNFPAPGESDRPAGQYQAPATPTEELLANLWRELLGQTQIGALDNFFELGGHSLLATQLASRIRDAFGAEIALRDLFENPVLADVAMRIDQLRTAGSGESAPAITAGQRPQNLPLSFAQQRLWFLDQLAPGQANYNIPTALRLSGSLDAAILERCINELARRHESLRTTFAERNGEPQQLINPELIIKLEITDLSGLDTEARQSRANELAMAEANRPFNLRQGPLFRAGLLKLGEQEHVILFTLHHAISDGWSMGVLVKEVAALYDAFLKDEPSPLPELPAQYADYALWQRNWLQGDLLHQQIKFWQDQIGLNPPALELPTDHARPPMQTFSGRTLEMRLSRELSDQINAFSRKEGATLFMTLLAVFQSLMHRYSGQDQILVGSPIANRTRSEVEGLIGFFVNTLVLKADFSDDPDFRALLRQIREFLLQAYAHQDLPFEQLVEALQPQRDMSHSPLFQVAFILQNMALGELRLTDLTIQPVTVENRRSKYDITLNSADTPDGLAFYWEYNTDLFEEATIRRMMRHFQNLLLAFTGNPKLKIQQAELMDAAERDRLVTEWNQTARPYPDRHSAHRIFEEYARIQPQALAAEFRQEQLSYSELNRRANRLAHLLRDSGIGRDTLVGFCLERSLNLPVTILGILKAGGAFLSIDPTYPKDRIAYMLEDSGVQILITQEALLSVLPISNQKVIALDRDAQQIARQSEHNPEYLVDPDNLAYIIYTSGSTGKPKGTLLSHRGLCNLSKAQQRAFDVRPDSKILQFSSLSFDASVWESVMALLNGAALVYASQDLLSSGEGLFTILKQHAVTAVTLPPSVLAVMPEGELPDLRTLITAGEKCTRDLTQRWGVNRRFINAYGPTETTVCASMFEAHAHDEGNPPIGLPIDNFQLYVLDRNGQPVSFGVPGELCVGGVGLARGYLNRPDLTAEKFAPNPFIDDLRLMIDDLAEPNAVHQSTINNRLYRTGDLVRRLPNGNIEFLGRIDHQVKVRGFRIELGEIEAALVAHPQVQDAVVVARQETNGEQRLVAYYISESKVAAGELRSYLRQQLPEYMTPAIFMALDRLPLTPNGKVDRKALPAPQLSRDDLAGEYVAPRNAAEEKLCALAGELLHLEKIGVHDNFFELGGHSLLATKFMSRIRDQFQVELPLRILFEKPTVALLKEEIEQYSQSQTGPIGHTERSDDNIEQLLANIQGLSDEEVAALLADEANQGNE
jgi:amino acid adenylation domain-containing protein